MKLEALQKYSSEKRAQRKEKEQITVFEVPQSRVKPDEPWSPALLYIDKVLDHENIYIAPWSKKQIRFLSYASSILLVMERYIKTPITWIKSLIHEYMSLSKYENGRLLKSAENVARSHGMKTYMSLSRVRRMIFGEE
ncbi:MAG: hypothetical protein QW320_11785 [Ignisphaera sp.]